MAPHHELAGVRQYFGPAKPPDPGGIALDPSSLSSGVRIDERDGWLSARGVTDDRGQLFMLLEATLAWDRHRGRAVPPPCGAWLGLVRVFHCGRSRRLRRAAVRTTLVVVYLDQWHQQLELESESPAATSSSNPITPSTGLSCLSAPPPRLPAGTSCLSRTPRNAPASS
jgi:hypothetical protein